MKFKCPSCGKTFSNNPKKHLYRPKQCPYCRTNYTHAKTWLPTINFKRIKEDLQKAFSFIGSKWKDVVYVCPSCGGSFCEGEFKITQLPDGTNDIFQSKA